MQWRKTKSFTIWSAEDFDQTGTASVNGEQIARLEGTGLSDVSQSSYRSGNAHGDAAHGYATTNLVVAQEPDDVAMYLQPASISVPGAPRCEEVLSVNFGEGGSGKQHQLSGWSDTESTFTWTDAGESHLQFPPLPANGQYILRLVGNPFICKPKLARQRIGLAVNDETLGDFTIRDIAVVEAAIPQHIAGSGSPIHVTLRLHDAARPTAYGRPDDRLLAFALHRAAVLCIRASELAAAKADTGAISAGGNPS